MALAARPAQGVVSVEIGNALVVLDLVSTVEFIGAGTIGNAESNANSAATDIMGDLQQALNTFAGSQIDPSELLTLIPGSDSYSVSVVHYRVEYLDAGVRISQTDVTLPYTGLERFWVRSVEVQDNAGSVLGSTSS